MKKDISRRAFVKSSLIASAAVPLGLKAQDPSAPAAPPGLTGASAAGKASFPMGEIAGQQFSRLIMGGNLIAGWSHSRELSYVSTLMRRYNTPAKIRQTLELGESHGITAINTWVMDDNTQIFEHWKAGGKMKWFAQVRLDAGGGFSQIRKAIDEGAVGIHLTGDAAEDLLNRDRFEKVGESVEYIRSQKRIAGIGAHDLRVVVESERRKLNPDFYQKTLHTRDYFTALPPGQNEAVGPHDNSWCSDAQAVADVFAKVKQPWIAFKILAAGGIHPRAGFPYAFNSGADFILVGMFDWQIAEDVELAKHVLHVVGRPNSRRTRPWC